MMFDSRGYSTNSINLHLPHGHHLARVPLCDEVVCYCRSNRLEYLKDKHTIIEQPETLNAKVFNFGSCTTFTTDTILTSSDSS